jgi:hypothetical protein
MYRNVWKECHSSVCSITFLRKSGTRITSFTGFRLKDYLITDNILDKFSEPAKVIISFTGPDGFSETASKRLSYADFRKLTYTPPSGKDPGYLVLKFPFKEFKKIPSLKGSRKFRFEIGHPVAVLGYQLEQKNLSIKNGIISSCFRNSDVSYLQVDCSIVQGNAGCPVIDPESQEVIGVIGHRLAYRTRAYQEMMRIINKNLKILKEAEGKYSFDDIDPVQVLMVNQSQIKHMATDFYKTTTLRVGYAAELCSFIDVCPDAEDVSSYEVEMNPDD